MTIQLRQIRFVAHDLGAGIDDPEPAPGIHRRRVASENEERAWAYRPQPR